VQGRFASALRRSSLDEEVVCGGQAWPAYQIRGVFWSCSRLQGPGFPRERLAYLSLSLSLSLTLELLHFARSRLAYLALGRVGEY